MNASNFYYPLSALVNAITSVILGLFILSKNRRDIKYVTYALFCLSIVIWSSFYFAWLTTNNIKLALFYSRALMAGATFIPIFYLHHICSLLNQVKKRKKIIISAYLFGALTLLLDLTPYYIANVKPRLSFKFWPSATPLFTLFLIMWGAIVIYGAYLIWVSYKNAYGIEKNRLRYVLIATVIGWGGGATNFPLWYNVPLFPFLNILVSAYVVIVGYAIIRHHLMNINVALTNAGIFVIVYLIVMGIPFGLAGWFRPWLISVFGQNWFWLPMLLLLGLATIGPFLYLYLQRRAEDGLLREQRRYQETLRRASKDMTLIKDLKHLLKLMVHILTKTIRLNYAAIYLYDEKNEIFILKANNGYKFNDTTKSIPKDSSFIKYLTQIKNPILIEDLKSTNDIKNIEEDDINKTISIARSINATLIIPSFVDTHMLGFLALGNKISGHTYTDDDLSVLSVLANQAALAIENAQFYEKTKIMEVERIQSEKFATIGRLATSAKHEINNPLQMICWNFDDMSMRLKDTEDNFHNVKERLDETVKNMREMILTVTTNNTLAPEILHGLDEINNVFNETLLILDSRGMAETEFVNKISNMCARVEANKICLTKACENIVDEKLKDKIDGIIHSSGTLSKNVMKIRDAEKTFWKNIKSAKENAKRIENQTQIMHDLPRKLDKELTAIDINKLLEASFEFAKQQTYWENLGDTPVEKNIPVDFPKIRGYFSRLQIVFLNLIMNAYQAMTDAGLKTSSDRLIRVNVNIDPKNDNFLEIHFANKGPLIPKENLERIFERDYTTKKEGSGLGLHISRIQVEINNGIIYAKNIEGFGPEFIVRLPIWKELK